MPGTESAFFQSPGDRVDTGYACFQNNQEDHAAPATGAAADSDSDSDADADADSDSDADSDAGWD